jgi:hypothetical protein
LNETTGKAAKAGTPFKWKPIGIGWKARTGTLQTGRGFVLDYVEAVDDMGKSLI